MPGFANLSGGSIYVDINYSSPTQAAQNMKMILGIDSTTESDKKNKAWMFQNGFYRSKGEFGIKALSDDRFALLYIPKGATVHVDVNRAKDLESLFRYPETDRFSMSERALRKHRADKAYVVDLCKLVYRQEKSNIDDGSIYPCVRREETLSLEIVHDGKSLHDATFEYHTGSKLVIDTYDYDNDVACSQGIHFFTSTRTALDYAHPHSYVMSIVLDEDIFLKNRMFVKSGPELLDQWMTERIVMFNETWRNSIHEESCEDDDPEEAVSAVYDSIYDSIAEARRAIDKLAESVESIKPAERNDVGRYCYSHPAHGARCNCDACDESDDRPP